MNFSTSPEWLLFVSLAFAGSAAAAPSSIDWANPPIACIEDLVPQFLPCLDLRDVANPILDLPALTPAETQYWTVDHRPDLFLCRAKEVNRREAERPGSRTAAELAWAWMWVKQTEDLPTKLTKIYDVAETVDMPAPILFGALKQESLLSNLGIAADGSNYSCGIGQVNILEWCDYVGTLSPAEQTEMGWPTGITCGGALTTELVRPFYEIALRRLGARPDYELTPREFSDIPFDEVVGGFPAGDTKLQRDRFRAVTAFVRDCSDISRGIAAKGRALRSIFDRAVPTALKKTQLYGRRGPFPGGCQRPYRSKFYPLHTGWLLADAIYNAGDREVSLLEYYFRMTGATADAAWKKQTPTSLIEGLHWGGKWNRGSGKIEFRSVSGTAGAQSWYKSCVVQRHVARVIQYVSQPGFTIAQSLEQEGCSPASVPYYRKKSPGRIPAKKLKQGE